MGSLRAKLVDRNRYSKKYTFIKVQEKLAYLGDQNLSMELGTLSFTNEDVKTLKFEISFPDKEYTVVATAREISSAPDGSAMVALVIDGTSISEGSVTIRSSAKFTGKVDILAIRIGK